MRAFCPLAKKTPHCRYDYITDRMVILYLAAMLTEWH